MSEYSVIDTVQGWQLEPSDITVFGTVESVENDGYDVTLEIEDEWEPVSFPVDTYFELYAIVYDVVI